MAGKLKFKVISSLGKSISTTVDYWQKIINTKHANMAGQEEIVTLTLTTPEQVRRSRKDDSVHLYYRKHDGHYCCAVVKHLNGDGFLVTAYITDTMKVGEPV